MPKFIYSISIISIILISLILVIINFTNPENLFFRIPILLLIFLLLTLLLPLIRVIFTVIYCYYKKVRIPDLLDRYKKNFRRNVKISFIVSIFYGLKIFGLVSFSTFVILTLGYVSLVIINLFLKKLSKDKNLKKY
jgi:hypothetical protein